MHRATRSLSFIFLEREMMRIRLQSTVISKNGKAGTSGVSRWMRNALHSAWRISTVPFRMIVNRSPEIHYEDNNVLLASIELSPEGVLVSGSPRPTHPPGGSPRPARPPRHRSLSSPLIDMEEDHTVPNIDYTRTNAFFEENFEPELPIVFEEDDEFLMAETEHPPTPTTPRLVELEDWYYGATGHLKFEADEVAVVPGGLAVVPEDVEPTEDEEIPVVPEVVEPTEDEEIPVVPSSSPVINSPPTPPITPTHELAWALIANQVVDDLRNKLTLLEELHRSIMSLQEDIDRIERIHQIKLAEELRKLALKAVEITATNPCFDPTWDVGAEIVAIRRRFEALVERITEREAVMREDIRIFSARNDEAKPFVDNAEE